VKKEKGGGKALNLKLNMELSKIKQPRKRKEVNQAGVFIGNSSSGLFKE